MTVLIDDRCTACGACLVTCPEQALAAAPFRPVVDDARCTDCLACLEVCPVDAIVPHPIEVESYRRMAERVDLRGWPAGARDVVARMIHATADESFAESTRIGDKAVAAAVDALRRGAPIVCDARMVMAGLTSLPGATCLLDEVPTAPVEAPHVAAPVEAPHVAAPVEAPDVAAPVEAPHVAAPVEAPHVAAPVEAPDVAAPVEAPAVELPPGDTRSAAAIRLAAARYPDGALWVIGNAPTALAALLELHAAGDVRPAAVIGLPVGYVGAAEAKSALWASPLRDLAITNMGNRGGSAVAAAAVNALARLR